MPNPTEDLERRVDMLERRLDLLEKDVVADDARARRARAFNLALRVGVYGIAIVLLILFLVVMKGKW